MKKRFAITGIGPNNFRALYYMDTTKNKSHRTVRRSIVMSFPALLFFSPRASVAESLQNKLGPNEIEPDKDLDDLIMKMISEYFRNVIKKRDSGICLGYFVTKEHYLSLSEIVQSPVDAREMNFLHQRDMFVEDTEMLMDMIPKTNIDTIRLVSVEKSKCSFYSNFKDGLVYRAMFTYGEGSSRFEIIFPTIVRLNDELKFSTRFWVPVMYTL